MERIKNCYKVFLNIQPTRWHINLCYLWMDYMYWAFVGVKILRTRNSPSYFTIFSTYHTHLSELIRYARKYSHCVETLDFIDRSTTSKHDDVYLVRHDCTIRALEMFLFAVKLKENSTQSPMCFP